MAVKTVGRMPGAYFKLVKRFPLEPIRSDAHLDAAAKVLDALLQQNLDRGGQAYLDVLTDLVEAYEDEHIPFPDPPAADVLRELMATNRLSQLALAQRVGISQSTISAVLNGKRSLTSAQIIALAKFFGVGPAAFLPA
jgi:HTH-type transcriptional regulator / antitoxin HigA